MHIQNQTALYIACAKKYFNVCVELLKHPKIDVSLCSPLFKALETQNVSIANLLLKHYSNCDLLKKYSKNELTVMHCAVIGGCLPLIESVYQQLKLVIKNEKKLDQFINLRTKITGETALHLACQNWRVTVTAIKFLVDKCNADCEIKDRNGHNALYYARKSENMRRGKHKPFSIYNFISNKISK